MAEVGDKVSVTAKAGPRLGVVVSTTGALLRVRWESGEESSIVPGPGTLRVLRKGRKPASTSSPAPAVKAPAKKATAKAPAKKATAKKATAKKAAAKAPAKKAATKRSPAKKTSASKATAKKASPKRKGR